MQPGQPILECKRHDVLPRHDPETGAFAREEADRRQGSRPREPIDDVFAVDASRFTRALDRRMKPRAIDRFEQIVDGVELERVHRISFVCRAEDDRGSGPGK